ncbi:hypothetical protein Tco_0692350, partial [Tanacetum coccineum]
MDDEEPSDDDDDDDDDAKEEEQPCRTTPGPGYEGEESSAAGAARQVGPTTDRADLYGFADMLDAAPGRQTSRELRYGITDTWDDLVGAIQEIA